jgi:hypothetical protein
MGLLSSYEGGPFYLPEQPLGSLVDAWVSPVRLPRAMV